MLAERITASQLAEMSAQAASLSTSLRPADLPRLSQIVVPGSEVPADPLVVEVGFAVGPEELPVIRVRVHGVLHLACQRCLSPVRWPLDVDVALTAVATDAQTAELPDPFDSVVLENGELALRLVVEDEILAALPLAPFHADATLCSVADAVVTGGEPAPRLNRPFAGLASLMGHRLGGKDQD